MLLVILVDQILLSSEVRKWHINHEMFGLTMIAPDSQMVRSVFGS